MNVINANSVDPDQTPRSVAPDLGLHCLPKSYLWELGTYELKTYGTGCIDPPLNFRPQVGLNVQPLMLTAHFTCQKRITYNMRLGPNTVCE